jgi:hypothetical protein
VQEPRSQCGAEIGTSRRFFSFEPGLVSSPSKRALTLWDKARLGGVYVPRIWTRSIGPREITVKSLMHVKEKKSQNVLVAVTKLSISSGAISVLRRASNT